MIRVGSVYRKMSLHFPLGFPLISDRSVWQNGKHPFKRILIFTRFSELRSQGFSSFKDVQEREGQGQGQG